MPLGNSQPWIGGDPPDVSLVQGSYWRRQVDGHLDDLRITPAEEHGLSGQDPLSQLDPGELLVHHDPENRPFGLYHSFRTEHPNVLHRLFGRCFDDAIGVMDLQAM